jgi:hypothetical protein
MSVGQNAIGPKFDEAFTVGDAVNTRPPFELGTVMWAPGKAYVFCQVGTGGVTGDGYVVTLSEGFEAVMLTTSNDAEGDKIGVAECAAAEDDYIWVQVWGSCGIRTEQDAAANAFLGATADAGQVDDSATTGLYISGMTLGTATGGADAVNTTGSLNWPHITVRMEPEA